MWWLIGFALIAFAFAWWGGAVIGAPTLWRSAGYRKKGD